MNLHINSAYMIIDLQYGSTGKGLLAGYLAKQHKPDTVVTAWAPNAGHTFIDENGRKYVHRMLANGVVSPNLKNVLIGPGSILDIKVLRDEIMSCSDLLKGKTIIIHPSAAVVTPEHLEIEKRNVKIGSTMKGTGAAAIQRIERDPDNNNTIGHLIAFKYTETPGLMDLCLDAEKNGINIYVSHTMYRKAISASRMMQIEGAQGFSLSMYHGHYPYTTSRDVTPAQVLADCGLPLSINPRVIGTLRTYPIRVANRFDENGVQIGTSGPCHLDQEELSWEDLGLEPELTTVTKLPRRVFSFSMEQLKEAVFQCSPHELFLNFANYMDVVGYLDLVDKIQMHVGMNVSYHGCGAAVGDVTEDIDLAMTMIDKNAEGL